METFEGKKEDPRRTHWDNNGRFRRLSQVSYNSTSFFFTSFPSRFPSRDMYEVFQDYGKLDEVVIPSKKDVRGRRYDFIRFFNVADSRDGKLEVSFSDKDGEVPRSQPLLGKSSVPPSFDSNLEATFKILNKAYVGVVENPRMTYNMQETFNMGDSFKVKVTPLGENLCFLEKHEVGVLEELLVPGCDCLFQWFKEVCRWSPADVDPERVTWLRVYGITCHVGKFDLFAFITKTVGPYICVDDCMSTQTNFDVARILVRIGCSLAINEIFSIKIEVVIFRIKVLLRVRMKSKPRKKRFKLAQEILKGTNLWQVGWLSLVGFWALLLKFQFWDLWALAQSKNPILRPFLALNNRK
ncbi:hypothetical protein KIW84_056393 [Lathyrus oleraceus]|uniref:RRM domain-containing protein n=1 Tax=Pisum sativum TaxID=3888 RepID=A0A9D4WY71_PEA|nr:hypothetical protein KIW84_056393 [Pisum sativum]